MSLGKHLTLWVTLKLKPWWNLKLKNKKRHIIITKGKGGKKKPSRIKAGYGTYTPPEEEMMEDEEWLKEAPPMEIQIKRTRNPFKMGRI